VEYERDDDSGRRLNLFDNRPEQKDAVELSNGLIYTVKGSIPPGWNISGQGVILPASTIIDDATATITLPNGSGSGRHLEGDDADVDVPKVENTITKDQERNLAELHRQRQLAVTDSRLVVRVVDNTRNSGEQSVSANLFGQGQGDDHPSNNGRRVGKLGAKTSASASSANCATGLDIQLYEDSDILTFSASARACRSGKAYAGATADGKQQISLVPGSTPGTNTFTASVNDVDTGAVYSIAPDGNGDMMVVERFQEDFGEELDAMDELSPEERKLLDEANLSGDSSSKVVDFTSGLRGKAVANQFKDLGDQYVAEQQGERELQGNTIIDVLDLWTAHAECRTSSLSRGCTRTATTEDNMRARINLAMAETNTAYAESGVNVELNLVHAYYTTYEENRGFTQALYDLQGTTDVI
jgi:hypothetical protein